MAPINTRIFVRNLAHSVDEQKLQEVFSTSGRIVFAQLMRDEDGHSKGMGLVEFTHPVEALQAMVMMKEAKLYGRHLIVCQDRVGPSPVTQTGFTQGLVDVSGGIGKNGTKVRVDFIEGNSVIHSPDCTAVSDTPITYKEATDFFTCKKVLRGILVLLKMIDVSSGWARTSPAQTFVDNMMAKMDEMILAAYTCMDKDGTDKNSVRDLIVNAEGIVKEFRAQVSKPETWVHDTNSDINQLTLPRDEMDVHAIQPPTEPAGAKFESQNTVGGQYYVHLRHLRTENELRTLIRQLQTIAEHFEDIGDLTRMLKHGENSIVNSKGCWDPQDGDIPRPI